MIVCGRRRRKLLQRPHHRGRGPHPRILQLHARSRQGVRQPAVGAPQAVCCMPGGIHLIGGGQPDVSLVDFEVLPEPLILLLLPLNLGVERANFRLCAVDALLGGAGARGAPRALRVRLGLVARRRERLRRLHRLAQLRLGALCLLLRLGHQRLRLLCLRLRHHLGVPQRRDFLAVPGHLQRARLRHLLPRLELHVVDAPPQRLALARQALHRAVRPPPVRGRCRLQRLQLLPHVVRRCLRGRRLPASLVQLVRHLRARHLHRVRANLRHLRRRGRPGLGHLLVTLGLRVRHALQRVLDCARSVLPDALHLFRGSGSVLPALQDGFLLRRLRSRPACLGRRRALLRLEQPLLCDARRRLCGRARLLLR
mmetsp:Transcript_35855/g.90414  ORF Transcript_35855/g.90414 Transcript_35855/m.90414 type:complete len:368 (-) Transcript_35855:280-1383(-)